ncbi:hypothetical protein COX86_04480 [Candidatus Micrarchaeota archaeon CG_4_10_14_0_2_um_filter_60_11]|nr:MAG: hypothetical protein COT58_00020 [Candidatus Micrarchaeota archaeon CG09_land_8_20_14_0_10_60_16]PIY91508.1 MAG: hypothetical protein COY71_02800 [Candidatus Micrarchaeota archaeon CG_4_10_14_0_8_um_filter_60_7]PIZ90527.1 MAG: hypothetical protein COX86_04480 [Candidatus Micrarchaeota archaeon CG_4_10_14_0_2_um_filter_60_11]
MLRWLLGSEARERVLCALFGGAPAGMHFREIVKRTGCNPRSVKSVLDAFEAAGAVESVRRGNQRVYSPNAKHFLYGELSSIARKSGGLAGVLKKALDGSEVRAAFVYGSLARGDERSASDVDLIVVGKMAAGFYKRLNAAEEALGREVNPSFYSEAEFREAARKGFLKAVLKKEKLMVIGSETELERLA